MNNLNDMVNKNDYQQSFNLIANYLLNCIELHITDKIYELTEIEFYYNSDDHKDTSLHGDDLQKTSNQWYLHNKGRGGIDITFGNNDSYGGILIRGIQEVNSNTDPIDGPLNVMNFFKSQFGCQNKNDLQKKFESKEIALISIDCKEGIVYQGPRVGLVQIENPYLIYPYRYLKNLSKKHKFVKKLSVYYTSIKLGISTEVKIAKELGYEFSTKKYEDSLSLSINKNKLFLDYFKNI